MTEPQPSLPSPPPLPTPSIASRLRARWRRWLIELLAVIALVVAFGLWQTRHVPNGPAPVFSGVTIEPSADSPAFRQGLLSLSEWRATHPDRALVLYFWAEWCPICKLNEGAIESLRADHPVLTIAMQSGDAAAVNRHLNNRGLTWSTVIDSAGEITARYGLSGVPAVIILDPQGRIRFSEQGYTTATGIRMRLWWASWFSP